jgi:transcriptional regulator with XRE-family HTH domain
MVKCGKLHNNKSMRGYAQDNPFSKERKLLGERIKNIREKKKLTQEDLADKASVDVSYLAKIENGYVNTTIRYLIKLSKALGVKAKDLFDF